MNSQHHGDQLSNESEQQALSQSPPESDVTKTEISGTATEESGSDKNPASELAREFRWFEVLSLVINGALAIIGIGALYVYNGQLKVMRVQLEQMKGGSAQTDRIISETHDLADAANRQATASQAIADAATGAAKQSKAALDASINAARSDQRAWITVEMGASLMTLGELLEIPVTVVNSGRTPAENVRGNIILTAIRPDEELDTAYSQGHLRHEISGGAVLPHIEHKMSIIGVAIPKGGEIGNFKVNQLLIDGVRTGTARSVVYGKIEYSDIYGTPHWLTFCAQTTGTPPHDPLPTCTRYNAVDHNP